MTNELKPCPFCGGEAIACNSNMTLEGGVYCNVCRAGLVRQHRYVHDTGCAEAIAAWNTRATPDPLSDPRVKQQAAYNSEAVKALVELLREASDDLKTYVDADWPADLRAKYPAYQRKWERDMGLCNQIDATLRAIEEDK